MLRAIYYVAAQLEVTIIHGEHDNSMVLALTQLS